MTTRRITTGELEVLKTLLERLELGQDKLAETLDMSPGTLSRILKRLERYEWVERRIEKVEVEMGTPKRNLYTLTSWGKAHARDALQRFEVKGPLDAVPLNHEWSPHPDLNKQGPRYDLTYTSQGLDPHRQKVCDAVWEETESLHGGYELWTRDALSVRLRTSNPTMVELFMKVIDEVEETYYERRAEEMRAAS